MVNHITVQAIAHTGTPPFNILVEVRRKLDDTPLRELIFLISALGRPYCEKFEYSGTSIEIYPHIRNRSAKDLRLGVGFAYINRSVHVDRAIDLAPSGELSLKDSSVSTSSFPMYDYKGFNCGT